MIDYWRLQINFDLQGKRLTASVSGGRGNWQEKAKGRKCSKALNPFGRGQRPPPVRLHAMLCRFMLFKNAFL